MRKRSFKLTALLAFLLALSLPSTARAVSCTMQSEMTPANRTLYEQAARSLGAEIQAGNSAAVHTDTIASLAAHFDSINSTIQQLATTIKSATLTVDALYNLNASDIGSTPERAEFFCSVPGSSRVVTIAIPQLPHGNYLLALLHATGVDQPQQLALILQNDPDGSAQWKLAGLFIRPLSVNGHDGVWFWSQARAFAAKKQNWNAYFYYNNAEFLLDPVNFISSPNLQKLQKEMEAVKPPDVSGEKPLILNVNGQSLEITHLRTDIFQGGLDLVVDYKAKGVSDPVATRTQIVSLMKAMLAQHPELRAAFHGLWVYAYNSNGQPFAIELPMNQIQ
ncbi:MAG TPA: hypothetical protein VFW25_06115 [Silvibacterium sp.]|nr:hypothetical protein [Silvibacterium sp.]